MKNFRFIPVVILITALTGSSALAGAPTESGEEKIRTTSIPKSTGNPSPTPFQ